MKRITLLAVLTASLIHAAYSQAGQPSRAIFSVEFPEISQTKYVAPTIKLRETKLASIKFRVLAPAAANIDYGDIILSLNGAGINRGCDKKLDNFGKILHCYRADDRIYGFTLTAGKNILEIRATDKKGVEYYASYVLILGDKSAPIQSSKPPVAVERFTGRKLALVVGVSDYQFQDAGLENLDFADNDAMAIAEFLKSPSGGGFQNSDITLLLNKDATVGAFRSALSKLAASAKVDDLIFIFIAAHGAPDPLAPQNLYFLFSDSKAVNMAGTAYPMNELKMTIDNANAKRMVVLIDTCHSAGVSQRDKKFVKKRNLIRDEDENNISNFYLSNSLFREDGRAILTSSDVDEVSQESSKWDDHGVFTWAILRGLNGEADSNRDRRVTIGELFAYTRAKVSMETRGEQNPISLTGTGSGLSLAIVSGGKPK